MAMARLWRGYGPILVRTLREMKFHLSVELPALLTLESCWNVSVHLICEMLGICPQTHQQSCRSQLHQALQLTWEWFGFSLLEICKAESTWINTSGDHMCSPHKVHSDALTAVNNREHKRWLVLPAFFLFTQAFWMKSFSKCGVRQPQRASSFQALSSINWSPKSISGLSLELLWSSHWKQKHLSGSHLGHIWYHLLSAHPIIRNIGAQWTPCHLVNVAICGSGCQVLLR